MPIAETVVSLLPALPWLLPFGTLPHLARRTPRLEDVAPVAGPMVSVIVPARNESDTIDTLLTSLRASDYPDFEVLVVDDRSDDDTPARVRRHAEADPRIRLVSGEPLPAGWFGKPWACLQGYRAARGEVLLFTDADTRHSPDLLGRAVAAREAERADLFTVLGHQRCDSFWERVIQPQVFYFLGLRYHPARVNAARRARDVIANGQFILMPRASYEAIGTHEAVRGEVAEDLMLAQTVFRAGRRLRLWFAEGSLETRMYRSLGGIVEGWSKNSLVGGRRSWPDEPVLRALTPLMLLFTPLFTLIPTLALVGLLAGTPLPLPAAPIVTAVTAGGLFWVLVFSRMGIPPRYALGYPVGAAVLLYVFGRSVFRGGRRIEWRGRTYAGGGTA